MVFESFLIVGLLVDFGLDGFFLELEGGRDKYCFFGEIYISDWKSFRFKSEKYYFGYI